MRFRNTPEDIEAGTDRVLEFATRVAKNGELGRQYWRQQFYLR